MNDNKQNNRLNTKPFYENLTILFIALKLCGVISWCWIWVLAPFVLDAIVIGCINTYADLKEERNKK